MSALEAIYFGSEMYVCVRIKLRCLESGVLLASGIIVGCAPICILCIQIVTFTGTHKHTHRYTHILLLHMFHFS